jgi:hypothetical protein
VVEDGVTEDEVEALIREGEGLGLGGGRAHLQSQLRGILLERRQHPRGDVGGGGALDDPVLQQVEGEVAGSGADLQRVPERPLRPAPERLAHLGTHLLPADGAEVDAPLRVVGGGGRVVVALVDLLDPLGADARVRRSEARRNPFHAGHDAGS